MREIVIVGAGISGQVLHRELSRRGIASTLTDHHAFPREKVCGGVLQWDSWRYLSALFTLPEASPLYRASHHWGKRKISDFVLDRPMMFVPRFNLDAALDRQNASVHRGLEGRTRPLDTLTIWSFGAKKPGGSWIGFHGRAEDCGPSQDLRMYYGKGIYLGTVPLDARSRHAAFVVKRGFFRGIPDLKERVEKETGVRLVGELRGTAAIDYGAVSGALAIGDAKMPTHPFLGLGMKYAIRSARLMADHIERGNVEDYEKNHARVFRRYRWANRAAGAVFDSPFRALLRPFFGSRALFDLSYRWLHDAPRAV